MHRWRHLDGPGVRPQAQPPTSRGTSEDTGVQPGTTDTLEWLPEVLTAREAAAILRVGRNQLYQAVARGEIPAVRIGRTIRISKPALHATAPRRRRRELHPWTAEQLRQFLAGRQGRAAGRRLAAGRADRHAPRRAARPALARPRPGPGLASVRQALVVVDRHVQVSQPKTARGRRLIAWTPPPWPRCAPTAPGRQPSGSRSGPPGQPVSWWSPVRTASRCTPTGFRRRFSGARSPGRAAADPLARPAPHPRHPGLQAGVPPRSSASGWACHRGDDLDLYAHAVPALQRDAAATIADLVSGAAAAVGALG